MDVLEAIMTRRSIRKYSQKPVEFDKIIAVCEAGSMAPSAGNLQNWKFIIVTDKQKIKNNIAEACLDQECFQTAQVVIVVCADESIMERQYGLRGQRLYSIQNCSAAIQNLLLAAHNLDLGAAWIGAFNEERLKAILDIPNIARPQAVITLGYPAEEPDEKRMRHIDDVIRFDVYEGRFKDMHRILTDFSVEWEKQINNAKDRLKKPAEEFLKKGKDLFKKDEDSEKNQE